MNIKKYFRTSRLELRLIDYIAVFYLLQVFSYTVDDFKKHYPTYLVSLGLIFHLIALLTWMDERRAKSYFGTLKQYVYIVLPLGLTLTYVMSIMTAIKMGEINSTNYYNIILFAVTALPMIMFYSSIGFKMNAFDFLLQRRKGTNYLFLGLIIIMVIGQRFING